MVQAGEMVAQIRLGKGGTRVPAEIARLRAAGYTERTRHDDVLRQLLGEQRWAAYAVDPARLAAAAAITDGDRAGHDMPALLAKVIGQRRWENDDRSPSQSVAQVLRYRVTREITRTRSSATSAPVRQDAAAQGDQESSPAARRAARPGAASPGQRAATPYDGKLRELLGEHRWQQYAADSGRADVAALIRRADGIGRDVSELLTHVVGMRPFEDDPVSPARSVADVLHYRLDRALSKPLRNGAQGAAQLPDEITGLLSHGTAPAGGQPRQDARTDPAERQDQPSARHGGRPSQGREGR